MGDVDRSDPDLKFLVVDRNAFSDPATQARIEEMMQTFENSTYIKPSLTTR